MGSHHTIYLFITLSGFLLGAIFAFFTIHTRKQTRQRQEREANQANREQVATRRIAENGGQPLSARFATSDASRDEARRSV